MIFSKKRINKVNTETQVQKNSNAKLFFFYFQLVAVGILSFYFFIISFITNNNSIDFTSVSISESFKGQFPKDVNLQYTKLNIKHPGSLPSFTWQNIIVCQSGSMGGNLNNLSSIQYSEDCQKLPFHFVIGNGNEMVRGELLQTQNWNEQLPICSEDSKASEIEKNAIFVCLIGNFSLQKIHKEQFYSLVELVKKLKRDYNIPENKIFLQKSKNDTLNLGKYFPFKKFSEEINK